MEAKYGVVEGIMARAEVSKLVGNETKMRLEKMIQAGPYVRQTVTRGVDTQLR